ncbi:hypothetical protein SUGI_0986020 [Cryptomeria japonica]|uniref:plant UBX domain-containing protein 2 n=1 Tax=Cryptomeria japonica TaxID=3369 RepID=UPI002414C0EE|nr:plant UBX domain-containing protein 2 [Cryptomeria japonica]GLJ46755.1 hypothetical protein SUGI_0986020 [Cryptomeria japonica]
MDEVKGKVKGLMKKINNPFAAGSSSSKFKGQGRVLGSSSSDGTAQNNVQRHWQSSTPSSDNRPKNPPQNNRAGAMDEIHEQRIPEPDSHLKGKQITGSNPKPQGFDPYDSCISSRVAPKSGSSLDMFQCPICNDWFKSEKEVSDHVENCLETKQHLEDDRAGRPTDSKTTNLKNRVDVFMSGKPSDKTLEVVLKLLRNIVSDPSNDKFRRIRMTNPKIQETVGSAVGGVELLECVGFKFQAEGEDMWCIMELPSTDEISIVTDAIGLLEPHLPSPVTTSMLATSQNGDQVKPGKIDRQVRVFFAAPESMAAKIELPDSFFQLTATELKREADSRKKKIEDSQLLIPKSFREKQIKTARKRYKATVIRIQFPDGVILQGVFHSSEPANVLYQFARSALKDSSLDFELLGPAVPKSCTIPRDAKSGEKILTLEDQDLVPAALIKFKPIETDSIVFTGLCNDLLAGSEPLTPKAFPSDVEFKMGL